MIVFVKFANREGEVEVEGLSLTDSISVLHIKVALILGTSSRGREYDILFAGKIINGGTLMENGIRNNSHIQLVDAPVRITVDFEGIKRDISFSNDGKVTVGEVKKKVRESYILIDSYFANHLPGLKKDSMILSGNDKSIITNYQVRSGDNLVVYKIESPKEEDKFEAEKDNQGQHLSPIPESPKELRKLDLVISCDTSGSLGINYKDIIDIDNLVTRISQEIPDLRIGIIVHGDYTDYKNHACHVTDLSNDFKHLHKYIESVKPANPKSARNIPAAAYALALREARMMSWRDGPKALVIIGGGVPHPPSFTVPKISWWEELDCLVNLGVKVYGMRHAISDYAQPFYQEISERTGGVLVDIQNFDVISETLAGIAFRETTCKKLTALKEEVLNSKKERNDVEAIFSILTKPFAEPEKNQNWKRDNKSFEAWYDTTADAEFVHPWFALNTENQKWQHLKSTFDSHDAIPHVKVVVLGDKGVGKTFMLLSLTTKTYPEGFIPSISCGEVNHLLEVDSKKYNVSIFNTPSQEDAKLRAALYPQTDVFLICFSIASPSSLAHSESKWKKEVMHDYAHVPILLVGTKSDLREDPVVVSSLHRQGLAPVTFEEGLKAAKGMGAAGYVEMSSQTLSGLNEGFERAVRIVIDSFSSHKRHSHHKSCLVM